LNSFKEKLNLLVLDLDPEWRGTLHKVAEKAELKSVKFLDQLEPAITSVETAPEVVLWNISKIQQFNIEVQEKIIKNFPESEIVVAISRINEEDVVSLLQTGVTYICDKEETEEEFTDNFLRFLGIEKKLRDISGAFSVSHNLLNWVDISAPSESKFVESIVRFVSLLIRTSMDERKRRALAYVLREIGQNAIEWGNAYNPLKQFHISFCVMDDRIMIKLVDEGKGFDSGSLPDPRKNPLENILIRRKAGKRIGGYGIQIVKGLMDSVIFSEKGNSVIMTMSLEKEKVSQ